MARVRDVLAGALGATLSPLLVRSVLATLPESADQDTDTLDVVSGYELLHHVAAAARIFAPDPAPGLLERLHRQVTAGRPLLPTTKAVPVSSDADVVAVQEAAHRLLRGLFKASDCVRAITATSELARNISLYAGTGEVRLEVSETDRAIVFLVVATDRGPGIPHLDQVLAGTYRSKTGLGRGLPGARALLDTLDIQTGPQGTTIRGTKSTRRSDLARNA